MLTKADFQRAIRDSISSYPAIAPLYQSGDPRVLQHLDALATMLAMFSAQLETAMSEPFEKTRDATVLADAAMRGIVRKATPARVQIRAANKGSDVFAVESGRTVLDSSGLSYRIETPASVPTTGGEATFEAVQLRSLVVRHTVSSSEPFYAIEIPPSEDDSYLCGVAVSDGDGELSYRARYVNTFPDDRVFHIEADDRQRVYVRFGYDGVVGVQPRDGSVITLTVFYTAGDISPAFGSPFSFEYLGSPQEAAIELKMDAILLPGQNPPPMSVLRDLARYPSVYDHNAVFLGEFDFLVRRNFPGLQFLSVWNESIEEQARGANLSSINTIFVAVLSAIGTESVFDEPHPNAPITPELIKDAFLTATQKEIRGVILAADNSYKVAFYTPVRSRIGMTISARVAGSYVASTVRAQISEAIISEFGESSESSKRGRNRPLYQQVYALLKSKVAALSGGNSDLTVSIVEPGSVTARPEMWRYVAPDSLSVSVETSNILTPSWGR